MTLRLENLGRNFASNWAIRNVNAVIEPGSCTAILGANGAGKSTLLRLIAGWLPLAEGRISIDGHRLRPNSLAVRRRLMLLDEPLAGEFSIIETIAQAISDYRADRVGIEGEVADWFEKLDLVGIYGKSARAISKGQRYKIAMICLFLVSPYVWLLDEPFSAGLDAGGLQILEAKMREHVVDGGIVMFGSQWPEHANRLADQSVVLHEGELVCHQPIKQPVSSALLNASAPSLAAVLAGLGRG